MRLHHQLIWNHQAKYGVRSTMFIPAVQFWQARSFMRSVGTSPLAPLAIDPRLPATKKIQTQKDDQLRAGSFFLLFLPPTNAQLLIPKESLHGRASFSIPTYGSYVHEFCSRRVLSKEKHHKKNLKIHRQKPKPPTYTNTKYQPSSISID